MIVSTAIEEERILSDKLLEFVNTNPSFASRLADKVAGFGGSWKFRGGYAVHGTTPGNFTRLGTVASHGCIRLHPDNACVYYELVKLFGLDNSSVTVRDSL